MFDEHANDRRATLVAGLILLLVLAVMRACNPAADHLMARAERHAREAEFDRALVWFEGKQRRFGHTGEQVEEAKC